MVIRRAPKLTDAEIISRYKLGESRTLIALRCRVPDYHIEAILVAAGVRMRGPAEAVRLAMSRKRKAG